MVRKTTAIHSLNADSGLNRCEKMFYLLLNWVNNLFPYSFIDNDLKICDFTCDDLQLHWDRLRVKGSPARKLSDLFWLKLPWDKIRKELSEIHVLDTGCHSGAYGLKVMDWSRGNIATYTGIDLYEHDDWKKLEERYPNFRFYQCNANNILRYIPEGTNFFMTQSALEHFDEDLLFFEQIRDYILSCQGSVIQVHLFPAGSGLRLWRFHGVRQYTPRTVSKISRLFDGFSYAVLYRLGGKECIRLHYEFITKPRHGEHLWQYKHGISDFRELKTQEYERRALKAIEHDIKSPQKAPVFYALVIHSRRENRLF